MPVMTIVTVFIKRSSTSNAFLAIKPEFVTLKCWYFPQFVFSTIHEK
jgi:hypothetical protein